MLELEVNTKDEAGWQPLLGDLPTSPVKYDEYYVSRAV
jgi:hypothetical protein